MSHMMVSGITIRTTLENDKLLLLMFCSVVLKQHGKKFKEENYEVTKMSEK